MMTDMAIHSDLLIPPGEYLEEVLEYLGMTKDELARRMDRPATKLSPIFRGRKAITPDTALQLQKFLGVTSLHNVKTVRRYAAAFRSGNARQKLSPEAVAAWLRLGELKGREIECAPFDKSLLESTLPEIRSMTMRLPDDFLPRLTVLLAHAGIALVLCPHLPKTYAHGATFPLGREKTVLMLSIRGKWADIFWFSLFHELGHILLHDRNAIFVDYDNGDTRLEKKEKKADEFAANTLIPLPQWSAFIGRGLFDADSIRVFVHEVGVDAGIVVGRLQHENILQPSWKNNLRTRYEWS